MMLSNSEIIAIEPIQKSRAALPLTVRTKYSSPRNDSPINVLWKRREQALQFYHLHTTLILTF